jgi:hypothetical protein
MYLKINELMFNTKYVNWIQKTQIEKDSYPYKIIVQYDNMTQTTLFFSEELERDVAFDKIWEFLKQC